MGMRGRRRAWRDWSRTVTFYRCPEEHWRALGRRAWWIAVRGAVAKGGCGYAEPRCGDGIEVREKEVAA